MKEYSTLLPELPLALLHILIIRKLMNIFLGAEIRHWLGYIEWCVYYVFLIITNMYTDFPPHLLLLGNVLMFFVISSSTRNKSLTQKCVFSLLIYTIWMLVEIIVSIALSRSGFDTEMLRTAGSFISKMCMLLISFILSHCFKDNVTREIPLYYFCAILLIPCSSIYIIHHIFLIIDLHNEYATFSVTVGFLLLIANYVVFEVYNRISLDAELREENRLYEQQLELCSHQAEEQESFNLEIRKIRHDLKNHLSGLLGMVQTGKTDEAEKYISKLLNDGIGNRSDEISHCGNIVIDSLINHKYAMAKKYGIEFKANIFIPDSLPFESGHLVIILGNLLDNAFEACEEMTGGKRLISIDISYEKELFQLNIRNSYQTKRKR